MPYKEADFTTLYKYYSDTDELLYVGISSNPLRRSEDHARTKPWWTQVARAEMHHFRSKDAALEAESYHIKQNSPRYNIAGTSRLSESPRAAPGSAEERRRAIINIYETGVRVRNQDQLSETLSHMGFLASQPTISRDLAVLGLTFWDGRLGKVNEAWQ